MGSAKPAVTFDLWHTLVYLDPDAEEGYMRRQVDAAVRVLAGSDPVPGATSITLGELRIAFEKEYAEAVRSAGEGRSVTPAEQLTRAALATGRVPRPTEYLDALAEAVGSTPFRIAPGTLDVLQELRESGYSVGVISNTVGEPGRSLRPILTAMGLDDYVQVFTFSDEHPWSKPAPEIFECTLKALGSDRAAAVHIGDGWSDIEGARRAGLLGSILFTGLQRYGERYRTLFLPPGWEQPESDYSVAQLSEVVPIVQKLLPIRALHGS
jgi:FMN phosphatase YigB (HAD superfamily)